MGFALFLFGIGTFVLIIGAVATSLASIFIGMLIELQEFEFIVNNLLALILLFVYSYSLELVFVRLYKKFKVEYYSPTYVENMISKLFLATLMLVQFNVLNYLIMKVGASFPVTFITTLLSILFGYAIKQCYDSLHKIKRVPIKAEDM